MIENVICVIRQWRARPAFATLVVATLGVSLGLATAVFSLFDAILLRPLPYPESERLVRLRTFDLPTPRDLHDASLPDFDDWRRQLRSLAPSAAWVSNATHLTGIGPGRSVRTTFATPELFEVLRVTPHLGRTFEPQENVLGGDVRKVVLAYGLWQEVFAGSPHVLGRTIDLRGQPHEVIGVLPPGFEYPDRTQVWMPLMARYSTYAHDEWWKRRDLRFHGVVARLRPGVSVAQAQADADAVARALAEAHPQTNRESRIRIQRMRDAETGPLTPHIIGVTAAAGFLLLLGGINVGGLFVARAAGRAREMAVRVALGAEGAHLVRQVAAETLLYAAVGGAIGIAVASLAIETLHALVPVDLPPWMRFGLDARALGFAAAVSAAAAVLLGVMALVSPMRTGGMESLRQGSKGGSDTAITDRLRRGLIVLQVALAATLLVGAGLTTRSLWRLMARDTGIRTEGTLVASVASKYTPNVSREEAIGRVGGEFLRMREALATLPGVTAVSAGTNVPFLGISEQRPVYPILTRRRSTADTALRGAMRTSTVMPGFFEALGISFVDGRDFSDADGIDSQPVMVISQHAAERLFPGEPAIGQQIRWGVDPYFWVTVIGIVRNTTWQRVEDPGVELYFSHRQFPAETLRFLIATASTSSSLVPEVRRTLQAVNPDYIVERVVPFDRVAYESLWQRRLWGFLFAVFATVAILLTSVGLFGVMSYLVTQRTREFGVRLALGATRGGIVAAVLQQALSMTLAGVIGGLIVAAAMGRTLRALLFQTSAFDLLTFIGVPIVLGLVVIAACALPAWRASRVDPLVALRDEA